MNAVQTAMQAVDAAVKHRARIGRELTPQSNMLLVKWYEDALEAESVARNTLGAAIDAEKEQRLRDASFFGLI